MAGSKPKTGGKGKSASSTQPQTTGEGLGGKLRQFKDFFEESKAEIKKVVWPTRKETIATSIAVVIFTVVVAVFLGLVDLGLSKLVSIIL